MTNANGNENSEPDGWVSGGRGAAGAHDGIASSIGALWPRRTLGVPAYTVGPSARSSMDRASDYGSEGWAFESPRARENVLVSGLRSRAQSLLVLSGPCSFVTNP